jgi:hypothetical protein
VASSTDSANIVAEARGTSGRAEVGESVIALEVAVSYVEQAGVARDGLAED